MSGLRARHHGALILMDVWCGAQMADTTQRKTGVRLRLPVGVECAKRNATENSGQKLCQGEVLPLDRGLLMGVFPILNLLCLLKISPPVMGCMCWCTALLVRM